MTIISTDALTKHYGTRVGIEELELKIDAGSVFGFLGPNGSGKTTTIRLLLGLLRPSSGRATVLGLDCWRDSRRIKAEVGYLPGDLRMYPWMTLASALRIFGRIRRRDIVDYGMALAQQFQLEPKLRVRNMSRGMRQKLGLILALAHRPKLLILDEPTMALDPPMQSALYEILRERAEEGATVFFSSHSLAEVEYLCDRVAILRNGRMVADETLDSLRDRACRVVTLRWNSATQHTPPSLPSFLNLDERRGEDWHCTLTGEVMELVQWSAVQPLEDITIGRPDLDTVFRQYYADPESSS